MLLQPVPTLQLSGPVNISPVWRFILVPALPLYSPPRRKILPLGSTLVAKYKRFKSHQISKRL